MTKLSEALQVVLNNIACDHPQHGLSHKTVEELFFLLLQEEKKEEGETLNNNKDRCVEYIPGLDKNKQYYINPMFTEILKKMIGETKTRIDIHNAAPIDPEDFRKVHNGVIITWLRYPIFKNCHHILDVWVIDKEEKLAQCKSAHTDNTDTTEVDCD